MTSAWESLRFNPSGICSKIPPTHPVLTFLAMGERSRCERLFNVGNCEGRHCFGDICYSLHNYNFRKFWVCGVSEVALNLFDDLNCRPLQFYGAHVCEPSCSIQNQNGWPQFCSIKCKSGLLSNFTKNVAVEVNLSIVNIVCMECTAR